MKASKASFWDNFQTIANAMLGIVLFVLGIIIGMLKGLDK